MLILSPLPLAIADTMPAARQLHSDTLRSPPAPFRYVRPASQAADIFCRHAIEPLMPLLLRRHTPDIAAIDYAALLPAIYAIVYACCRRRRQPAAIH